MDHILACESLLSRGEAGLQPWCINYNNEMSETHQYINEGKVYVVNVRKSFSILVNRDICDAQVPPEF